MCNVLRLRTSAFAAALALAVWSAASASGVTLIQQADGTVKTYVDVNIRMAGQTLWLRSADQKGVLKISNGACSFVGAIQRCLPYAVSLTQSGRTHQIALTQGTVFLNLSNSGQHLPRSSEELAPRTVLALLHTQHGTYVTIKGRLDEVTQ